MPRLIREYGDAVITELRGLTPVETPDEPFDEAIVRTVAMMRPYLKQFADLVTTAVRFARDERVWDRVLAVHEALGTLMFRDRDLTSWNELQFDPYKTIAHDAFLTTIAIALDEERFDLVEAALARPYLVEERNAGHGPATQDYTVFRQYVQSSDLRKRRLGLNRISLDADMLHEAFPRGSVPSFDAIMQADFLLYVRAMRKRTVSNWYPYSLVYTYRRFAPFPIFARAESKSYFERIAPILATESLEAFKAYIAELQAGEHNHRMFDYQGIAIAMLSNSENLGTIP